MSEFDLQGALNEAGKFVYYPGMQIEIQSDTKAISKDTFQLMKINGKFTLEDAFLLEAVFTLGHATKTMILHYLDIQRKHYPKKSIPQINEKALTARMVQLARCGLVVISDYVEHTKKSVIIIYTCTMFGHTYFKNTLDMSYIKYDDNQIFHAEVETFKRLAADSMILAIARHKNCISASANGRMLFGKQRKIDGFTYGYAEFEYDTGEHCLYVIEPAFFMVDNAVISDEEALARTQNRMKHMEDIVLNGRKELKFPVIPIFMVENMSGLKTFCSIAKRRNSVEIYEHCLYTSENVLFCANYELDRVFMSSRFEGSGESINTNINLEETKWRAFR